MGREEKLVECVLRGHFVSVGTWATFRALKPHRLCLKTISLEQQSPAGTGGCPRDGEPPLLPWDPIKHRPSALATGL